MWGAIVGDVAGSDWEFKKNKDPAVPLFGPESSYTDDTVCTAAVAAWLVGGTDPRSELIAFGRRHLARGYGQRFQQWLLSPDPQPYGSWGNGSAMRVSPCSLAGSDPSEIDALAAASAAPTHGHPDAVLGARCLALCIRSAVDGAGKSEIRSLAESFGYDLPDPIAVRPGHRFDVSCSGTVPLALACALAADSFEQTLRLCVSMGGDADTLAACAGPVAEGLFGIPEWMLERVRAKIDDPQILAAVDSIYALPRSPLRSPRTNSAPPEGPVGAR